MSLETAFAELDGRLDDLEQAFDNLLWAVVQGQPAAGARYGHALPDQYEAAAGDALALVKEARAAAGAGGPAGAGPFDPARTGRALAAGQDRLNRPWLRFYTDFVSDERRGALASLKRERRVWPPWAQGVDDALGRCQHPLYAASQALARCWRDLVDRAGRLSVAVQASGVGQVVHLAARDGREAGRDGWPARTSVDDPGTDTGAGAHPDG